MLATQTLASIDAALVADGGASFRGLLKGCFDSLTDAFDPKEEIFRRHLGASMIGKACARELWYNFHWTTAPKFPAAVIRLFNRGHLEEARFVALLKMIGCEVWTHDTDGGQLRMHSTSPHFGGSLDCVVVGLPDLPAETPALGEFKTHSAKSFNTLSSEGVMKAKWEHYVQMNSYAYSRNLQWCFYFAVCKDDDRLYAEIFETDATVAQRYAARAQGIIESPEPLDRINASPGWYQCKFCDHNKLCHDFRYPEVNCRTCAHSTPLPDGNWGCERFEVNLPKEKQLEGCGHHLFNPTMLNGIEVIAADAKAHIMTYKRPDGTTVTVGDGHLSSRDL